MQQSQLNEVKRARIIAYLEHEKTIMQVARELRIPKSTVGRIK
jgi:IS30 family transposase